MASLPTVMYSGPWHTLGYLVYYITVGCSWANITSFLVQLLTHLYEVESKIENEYITRIEILSS